MGDGEVAVYVAWWAAAWPARHQAGKCLNMAVRKGLRRWWRQGRDNQDRNQQEANRDS